MNLIDACILCESGSPCYQERSKDDTWNLYYMGKCVMENESYTIVSTVRWFLEHPGNQYYSELQEIAENIRNKYMDSTEPPTTGN